MVNDRKNYRKGTTRKGKKRNQYGSRSGTRKRRSTPKRSTSRSSRRDSSRNKKCSYPEVCTKGGIHEWDRYSSGIRICTKCGCKLYFKDDTEPEFNSEPDIDFGVWH